MKNENYSFPSEAELKKIREKTSNPNYPYRNKVLPVNASAEEKLKYQICQVILTYQQENNLSAKEIAQKIEIPLTKTYDILLGKIIGFQLNELTYFAKNLNIPRSQIPNYCISHFISQDNQSKTHERL